MEHGDALSTLSIEHDPYKNMLFGALNSNSNERMIKKTLTGRKTAPDKVSVLVLSVIIFSTLHTRMKKKRQVTYIYSFNGYNVILHYSLKTIFTGYPAFHFRPNNSKQDINLTDFHYSRPSNEIIMLHILYTLCFFFVLV